VDVSQPPSHVFQNAPAWIVVAVLALAVLVALELGHRAGRRWPIRGNLAALQAGIFGIATLLMAFSFSAAEVRFDERRVLAVREANAIGTLYLRAGYLPPESRDTLRRLLPPYLELHIRVSDPRLSWAEVRALKAENDRLQQQLWAVLEGQAQTLMPTILLLNTNAMNEMIDVSAMRWAAALARLPTLVLTMLFTVTLASALLVSYKPGNDRRDLPQWALFLLTSVMVMLTLLDLDRPPRGFIRTSQQPLIELSESLRSRSP
jgi:hypothetical protein